MRDIFNFNTNHTNANMHTYTRLRRLRAMALGVLQKLHRAHLSAPAHAGTRVCLAYGLDALFSAS
jgi:hypothetical protein